MNFRENCYALLRKNNFLVNFINAICVDPFIKINQIFANIEISSNDHDSSKICNMTDLYKSSKLGMPYLKIIS